MIFKNRILKQQQTEHGMEVWDLVDNEATAEGKAMQKLDALRPNRKREHTLTAKEMEQKALALENSSDKGVVELVKKLKKRIRIRRLKKREKKMKRQ